jgi:hypothetical protein
MLASQFLVMVPITMSHLFVRQETNSDGWNPFLWKCFLTNASGNKFSCKYRMGGAHIGVQLRDGTWKTRDQYKLVTVHDVSEFNRVAKPIPPHIEDVLYSLASDCVCVHNGQSWECFAEEFGYNPDSIKGRKVYRKCLKGYHKLKAFFGPHFQEFLDIRDE